MSVLRPLLALTLCFGASWAPLGAQSSALHPGPAPATRQLRGLDREAADRLIAELQEAQSRLKAGDKVYFELLSGSLASYDQATISPRHAFLAIPFEQVWNIERTNRDSPQHFRLAYAPKGLGQPYWEIDLIVSFAGIERVTLLFKPPAPS